MRENKILLTKNEFDTFIKNNINKIEKKVEFGYQVEGKEEPYSLYYSEKEFKKFLDEMRQPKYQEFYLSYAKGKGSEIKAQKGRYGTKPPKMASVASSSRFCYLALRDGAHALGYDGKVRVEVGCPITGIKGTAPQIDAKIGDNTYVEVKCHEIFDLHQITLKQQYWNLIYGKENSFGFEEKDLTAKAEFMIPLEEFGIHEKHAMFDIKQLICHLLGIASTNQAAELVYLFYKPKLDDILPEKPVIDLTFEALKNEIRCIFESAPIRNFCKKHNIKLKAVMEHSIQMEMLTSDNIKVLYSEEVKVEE